MSYKTFEQWYALLGCLAATFLGLIWPVLSLRGELSGWRRRTVQIVLALFIGLSVIAPYLVVVTGDEQEKLIAQSGLITSLYTFVLFYVAYRQHLLLLSTIPYFFWFIYFSAVFVTLELVLRFVLLSGKYEFVKTIFPYLSQIGIQDFNFLSPLDYLLKFTLLGFFFRDVLKGKGSKKILYYLTWSLIAFELIHVFVFKSYQGYDSLSSTVKNIFILGSTSLFLYCFYQTDSVTIPLQKNPYFWIALGLTLPTLAELFLEFIFQKLYNTDPLQFYRLYLFRNTSQLISILLFTLATSRAPLLRFLPKEY